MGYYSDVGICLSPKAKKSYDTMLQSLHPQRRTLIKKFLQSAQVYHRDGAICFIWQWVKWHNSSDTIPLTGSMFFEHFLQSLNEEDYLFIRIGEQHGDVEEHGHFFENPFDMCLSYSIKTNKTH